MITYKIFKRLSDMFFAFLGLLILSPIFLICLILLSFSNNGKPFFFQERPSKGERVFNIIKFKTMKDLKPGVDMNDLNRMTKMGSFIRKYSLDEIPQLINVIKGDMSIVGPRPLLARYLPLYTDRQRRRHEVQAGITGWAQIKGRNTLSWEEKFEYDLWYVEHQSFFLDMKIILLTVKRIIMPEGVDSGDGLSMPEFMGTENE